MTWTLTEDLGDYQRAAGAFLAASPVRHTVFLTVTATLASRGLSAFGAARPLFGWCTSGGEVTAALLHTPPYPVLLTALPPGEAQRLADVLTARRRPLPGVTAGEPDARAFAAAWTQRNGGVAREHLHTRLFRLAGLTVPEPVPEGKPRPAGPGDADLVVRWCSAFAAEIHDFSGDGRSVAEERIEQGRMVLWEASGAPVSMAGVIPAVAGVARIGPVYTPPRLRRHGYAGAATVAASRLALDQGAGQVVLFTDLANPTSNALYQRIGYRPVEDRLVLSFVPSDQAGASQR